MASTIIHLTIAKEIKDSFNIKNETDYYLGSVAPDINLDNTVKRSLTHFMKDYEAYPNMYDFKSKYPNYLEDDFLLGYYVHLLSDVEWNKYILKLYQPAEKKLKLLTGELINTTHSEYRKKLYSDYSHLNEKLIVMFNLNTDLFFKENDIPITDFDLFDLNKINYGLKELSIEVGNSVNDKEEIFDLQYINKFINDTIKVIKEDLNI